MDKIFIFDTTLRDGEQAPGIALNSKEKLEIAEQLARLEVVRATIDGGATTINIPATVGYTLPHEFEEVLSYLYERVPQLHEVILSVHCHNDLGLAVANSLAAVRVGARQVEVAVNGIGERAGNCSLEEVVMALRTRRDILSFVECQVNTREIARTSRMVSLLTGYSIQPNKAIVGANAFAHESGIHQHGVLQDRMTYEIMDAEEIGFEGGKIVLGKHSGRHAFTSELEKMGYELTREELQRAFERFKELADKKIQISDKDIEAIIADEMRTVGDTWELVDMTLVGGTTVEPRATVRVKMPGGEVTQESAP